MKIRYLLTAVLALLLYLPVQSQKAAVKTNLISDGFFNPNAAVEFAVAPKWTVDLSGQFNLWKLSHDRQWRHWILQPEARYWFCDRFSSHFVGAHVLGGQFNIGGLNIPFSFLGTDFRKIKDTRYQGWFGGAGVAYGYDWVINEHWNIEAEIGVGWVYTRSDRFRCVGCGKKILENIPHNYIGPTKIAANVEYIF